MERTQRAPRQLPLFPAGDLGSPDDPVGAALGILDGETADPWGSVMGLFARLAVRAYHQSRSELEKER